VRPVKYRITVDRDGFKRFTTDVDAENESDALDKVHARQSTPDWVREARAFDVRIEPAD
jgi:hypothetical protein